MDRIISLVILLLSLIIQIYILKEIIEIKRGFSKTNKEKNFLLENQKNKVKSKHI